MLCRKKRLITSHKRASLRMDDDPVPKALMDAVDDLDDFKPLLEALHTLQLVQKCANNTANICLRKYACQIRAISVICLKIYSRD